MHHQYDEKPSVNDVDHLTILNDRLMQAEEDGDAESLGTLLTEDFTIIRAGGAKQDRETYLGAVEANAHRGRTAAEKPDVHLYGDCAGVTMRVTTSENRDGALTVRRFWSTHVFLRQEELWRCSS